MQPGCLAVGKRPPLFLRWSPVSDSSRSKHQWIQVWGVALCVWTPLTALATSNTSFFWFLPALKELAIINCIFATKASVQEETYQIEPSRQKTPEKLVIKTEGPHGVDEAQNILNKLMDFGSWRLKSFSLSVASTQHTSCTGGYSERCNCHQSWDNLMMTIWRVLARGAGTLHQNQGSPVLEPSK
ncbi:hypothetical protein T439DRAFT_40646 [Meredithblackwellia eburnea MCA 4105]